MGNEKWQQAAWGGVRRRLAGSLFASEPAMKTAVDKAWTAFLPNRLNQKGPR